MFFFLSKVLSYLIMPLSVTGILLLIGFFLKNRKWARRFRIVGLSMFLFFSNEFIANEVMTWWEIPPTPFKSLNRTYDYGVLLTGVTSTDKQPADRVYFNHGADRVVHTVDLFKKGIIRHIIVSGGSGRLITTGRKEAADVYKALILMGVPYQHITVEKDSRNTHESAVAVGEMLRHSGGSALLITSGFHMRRSLACFNRYELNVTPFSTDFYTHPRIFTPDVLIVPKVESWVIWHKLVKEWTGMLAYKVAGYI
ncbi:MAG: YdcF family protein [Cyclobacteriaceae bacterium]|nr:YdcF family protein [Cyclobacteriaceae bacterium]MCX7637075.1 YdcF family protein [Cyclobacteriaceae bacterium]MDW8331536.1 YdcF family protein [Cyclobacteriaceae bacterium]